MGKSANADRLTRANVVSEPRHCILGDALSPSGSIQYGLFQVQLEMGIGKRIGELAAAGGQKEVADLQLLLK